MKFGVREICDVVLRAKATQTIGNKTFFKDEPVCYFDTLKTSTLESAVTTVYAQGGRGNSRLIAWDGEKTVTFTMEDALISPVSFAILSGAGIVDATNNPIKVHATEIVEFSKLSGKVITLEEDPTAAEGIDIYVFAMKDGEIVGEPYLFTRTAEKTITLKTKDYSATLPTSEQADAFFVDYYVEKSKAHQIEITADKFGGNYYLEASTLFRNQNGEDLPAEFVIPNCKVQSNFTFSMAASGDPSTFTFTMDAFPDYTRWDKTQKVLCAIQIIEENEANEHGETRYITEVDETLTDTNNVKPEQPNT